ncbi:MAG: hypothetical protein VB091_10910 [Christensenella sp.]|nr:hypothetical protein [Christensenella sp.]
MPEHTYHEYHCVNCGAPLTPDDVVYDISGIAFFGALPGDYTQFPIYATKEKMETLFSWNEGKGTSIITLFDWISMIYEQCRSNLDTGTWAKDAEPAYRMYLEMLEKQRKQESYSITSVEAAIIPGLPDNLSRILVSNCAEEEVSHCTISYDEENGYRILKYAHIEDVKSFTDHRRCRQCHAMLLERAFQCEQTLIGFIGFQNVGKTCLIAALCKYLEYAEPGSQLLLRDGENQSFRRELKRYQNGFSLKQTNIRGINKVNPTIYLENGERPTRMLTLVDISGEAFNNDEGRFDPSLMENNFRAIAECSQYVFCTSLFAFEEADFGSMQRSLGNFISHITRTKTRAKPSPILVAVMQMDEQTICAENRKDVPYLDDYLFSREYNQIYNVRESEQLKAAYPNEAVRRAIDNRLQSFLASVNATLYYTPITCSAYGRHPVDQTVFKREDTSIRRKIDTALKLGNPMQIVIQASEEADILYERYQQAFGSHTDTIEIIKQSMDEGDSSAAADYAQRSEDIQLVENSPLRFAPNPRNINLIYDWIMRMIGELEIPARSKDKAPLPANSCQQLSVQDYHTSETDVQTIARMFVNPHKYDKIFYKIIQEPSFIAGIHKRNYFAQIAKAQSAGQPLHD